MNKKILWVDDDVNNPELAPERDELERSSIEVIPIETADGLLKYIESNSDRPDCIVIDMSMAVGNRFGIVESKKGMRTGKLMIEKLLERKQTRDVPIVIYSVVPQDEDLVQFCRDNNIQYWSKSDYMPDEFVEEISRMIE